MLALVEDLDAQRRRRLGHAAVEDGARSRVGAAEGHLHVHDGMKDGLIASFPAPSRLYTRFAT